MTVGLLPASGGVGSSLSPRVSRVRFPASTSRRRRRRRQGITSSRALPRLDGVPLRRRRRARGGGAPGVDPLYRSPWPAARREVSSLSFCFMVERQLWVVRKAGEWSCRFGFCGGVGRRRRVCFHGHRGLGRVPDRWFFSVCFVSSKMAGVYCGSAKSLLAMELWRPVVGGDRLPAMAGGDGFWRIRPAVGPRTCLHFLYFLGAFVLLGRDSCPLYPMLAYLYLYVHTISLTRNTGMFAKKRN